MIPTKVTSPQAGFAPAVKPDHANRQKWPCHTLALVILWASASSIAYGQGHEEPPDPCLGTCKVRPVSGSQDAPTYTVLYTFSGGTDGGYPQYGRLVADQAGNLYGTATLKRPPRRSGSAAPRWPGTCGASTKSCRYTRNRKRLPRRCARA